MTGETCFLRDRFPGGVDETSDAQETESAPVYRDAVEGVVASVRFQSGGSTFCR